MTRLALALLFGSFLQNAVPPTKATINGIVLRAGTGDPIARASVTLDRATGGFTGITPEPGAPGARGAAPAIPGQTAQIAVAPEQPAIIPAALTDDRGRFQIKDVDPGNYRIIAARNGFARQEYGQRSFNRSGTIISARPGQQVQDIELKLTPAPTISGRVVDMYGEPQPGITIQALRSTYDANGKRTLQQVQTARTNDLGEYRLYWLNPGRYFVSATGAKSTMETILSMSGLGGASGMLQGNRYNPVTGEFEIRDVAPGSYWLMIQTQPLPTVTPGARGAAPTPDPASFLSSINRAQVPLEVDRDIDNLSVAVTPGITIPGRIRIEGNPPAGQDPYSRLIPMLQTGGGSILAAALQGGIPRPAAPDGTFSLTKITPGNYRLVVNGLDPTMYIKDAHIDRTDVLQGIAIGNRVDGALEIVLSTNAGQVDGTIVDAAGKPMSGVQAVLIPNRLRNRTDLFKTATSGANGRFTLRGITPGDYKLFAWEDIEPFSYFDSDVLRPFEALGKTVRIQENSRETAEVKIIPATP
jgi:protocatechuate 3,4-dioxygenase beta subunit